MGPRADFGSVAADPSGACSRIVRLVEPETCGAAVANPKSAATGHYQPTVGHLTARHPGQWLAPAGLGCRCYRPQGSYRTSKSAAITDTRSGLMDRADRRIGERSPSTQRVDGDAPALHIHRGSVGASDPVLGRWPRCLSISTAAWIMSGARTVCGMSGRFLNADRWRESRPARACAPFIVSDRTRMPTAS